MILWGTRWPPVGACGAPYRAEVREAIHAAAFGLCAAATFESPTERPRRSAISRCLYPWISCRRKTLRKPAGKLWMPAFKIYSVDHAFEDWVRRPKFAGPWRCAFIVCIGNRFDRDDWQPPLAQTHQHEIDRQPVQPGRKGRFARGTYESCGTRARTLLE